MSKVSRVVTSSPDIAWAMKRYQLESEVAEWRNRAVGALDECQQLHTDVSYLEEEKAELRALVRRLHDTLAEYVDQDEEAVGNGYGCYASHKQNEIRDGVLADAARLLQETAEHKTRNEACDECDAARAELARVKASIKKEYEWCKKNPGLSPTGTYLEGWLNGLEEALKTIDKETAD